MQEIDLFRKQALRNLPGSKLCEVLARQLGVGLGFQPEFPKVLRPSGRSDCLLGMPQSGDA